MIALDRLLSAFQEIVNISLATHHQWPGWTPYHPGCLSGLGSRGKGRNHLQYASCQGTSSRLTSGSCLRNCLCLSKGDQPLGDFPLAKPLHRSTKDSSHPNWQCLSGGSQSHHLDSLLRILHSSCRRNCGQENKAAPPPYNALPHSCLSGKRGAMQVHLLSPGPPSPHN